MNTLNKIHYACTIELVNNNQDNDAIGMRNGTIRYVSDGIDLSGYNYEDLTPVSEFFFSDIVVKDGFSKMGSSIDIATGGDYAYLQSFNLTLANMTSDGTPYHKALDDEDTYVMGGKVKVYVIIDNILYERWSGVVSAISFNEKTFTWNCEDSHKSNNTISDTSFGLIKQLQLVTDNKLTDPKYNCEIYRMKPDKWVEDMFYKENVAPQMEPNIKAEGAGYAYTHVIPYQNPPSSLLSYDYYCSTVQSNHDYYQIWLTDTTIDMSTIKYVGIDDSNIEAVHGYDTYTDYTGTTVIRILVKSLSFMKEMVDQYDGDADTLFSTSEAGIALTDFNSVILKLYDSGVPILDGIDINKIDKLVDKNGTEISKDNLIQVNDKWYTPFNINTYTIKEISNNKITTLYNNSTDVDIDDMNTQYNGIILPTDTNSISHLLCDISDLDMSIYDEVFLGINARKKELIRSYSGREEPVFTFDRWSNNTGKLTTSSSGFPSFVNNSELSFKKTMSNGINITINTNIYNSWKYGTIIDVNKEPVKQFIPMGQRVEEYWAGVDSKLTFYHTGGTNLPTYTPSSSYPVIDTHNEFNIFYNPRTTLPQDGYNNVREFSMFYSNIDLEFSTTPDIKEALTVYDKILLTITSELFLAVNYYLENMGMVDITPEDNLAIETYIDFSLVGRNKNSSNDIFAKYINDETDTIGKVLCDLSNIVGYEDIRPTYFVGNYISEQVNKFNVISELCRQSFIGGWTNRKGETTFRKIMEYDNSNYITNNANNIIDKSIKNFKHTPISKVYNEFEVKYCYADGKPEKTLEIHNADRDSFPENTIGDDIWQPESGQIDPSYYEMYGAGQLNKVHLFYDLNVYNSKGYNLQQYDSIHISFERKDDTIDGITSNGYLEGEVYSVDDYFSPITGIMMKRVVLSTYMTGTPNVIETNTQSSYPHNYPLHYNMKLTGLSYYITEAITDWREYVVGVDEYSIAKSLWEKAHEGYLRTGVIQKAPSNRTDLKWAVERNWFYDNNIYDAYEEYGYDYFTKLIDWTIYQKFQVNYSLPITPDNIVMELLSDIRFEDSVILPNTYGKGWITKYEVDPKKDIINVQLTFEPNDINPVIGEVRSGFYPFTMVSATQDCNTINEAQGNIDTINEAQGNVDTINEQECN